jgi:glutamyl-Q tRNA(Asp) synthetase
MTTTGLRQRASIGAPTRPPAGVPGGDAASPTPYGGRYVGRFAPSPTGPLHAGSLVAALASWLDARAFDGGRGGQWLVRIEDIDTPRCSQAAAETILGQLAACGLHPDAPPVWQSARSRHYQAALDALVAAGQAYPCGCSRKDIEEAHAAMGHARERHAALPYPGTCRAGLGAKAARSWRLAVPRRPSTAENMPASGVRQRQGALTTTVQGSQVRWHDRRLGPQQQDVAADVGDFVLRRADNLWAYQLAVVVDDADQGITDVVRGEDLCDNTARQILLQKAMGLPTPRYLHTPLVYGPNGEKLSKQNGAQPLDLNAPAVALAEAANVLGIQSLETERTNLLPDILSHCVKAWLRTYNQRS